MQFFSGFLDGSNFTKPTHTFLVLFGGFFSLCIFVCMFVFLKVAGCRGSEICFHVVYLFVFTPSDILYRRVPEKVLFICLLLLSFHFVCLFSL